MSFSGNTSGTGIRSVQKRIKRSKNSSVYHGYINRKFRSQKHLRYANDSDNGCVNNTALETGINIKKIKLVEKRLITAIQFCCCDVVVSGGSSSIICC